MASPQLENGYLKIANELFEALIQAKLNGSEYSVVLWIIRKTYGFNKKKDLISLTQFQKGTSLTRATVIKTIKNLVYKKIITKENGVYGLNKDFSSWGSISVYTSIGVYTRSSISVYTRPSISVYTHKRHIKNKKQIGGELLANKKKMYTYQEVNDEGELIVKRRGLKKKVTEPPYEFNQDNEVKRLLASPAKAHKIAGHYILTKKLKYENRDQFEPDLARFIHTAKSLKGYDSGKIEKAFEYCRKKWPDDWTLETASKWIAEANK